MNKYLKATVRIVAGGVVGGVVGSILLTPDMATLLIDDEGFYTVTITS